MSFIKNLDSNKKIKLEKCTIDSFPAPDQFDDSLLEKNDDIFRIAYIDLETTGLDLETNEIIEIAIKLVEYSKSTGKLLKAVAKYENFNDPSTYLDDKIIKITGITREDVFNQKIDWNVVGHIIANANIIVAHNASFDRPVLEKYFKTYKVWACSQKDINWYDRGFLKENLEILAIWHGFYYDAHRAMNDVNATINLLSHKSYDNDEKNPVLELIENSVNPHYIIVNQFPYNALHIRSIKNRDKKYFYNSRDKSWRVILTNLDDVTTETEWLGKNIYSGKFNGVIKYINAIDKYKEIN